MALPSRRAPARARSGDRCPSPPGDARARPRLRRRRQRAAIRPAGVERRPAPRRRRRRPLHRLRWRRWLCARQVPVITGHRRQTGSSKPIVMPRRRHAPDGRDSDRNADRPDAGSWPRGTVDTRSDPRASRRRASGAWPFWSSNVVVWGSAKYDLLLVEFDRAVMRPVIWFGPDRRAVLSTGRAASPAAEARIRRQRCYGWCRTRDTIPCRSASRGASLAARAGTARA